MKYANYIFEYVEIEDFYFPYKLFWIKPSAISTAFSAAPLSKLSETIHKFIVFAWDSSSLILEINVSNLFSASTGVINHPSLCSSTTLQPGEEDKTFLISSKLHFLLNSTFALIQCDTRTGILTQVDVTLILLSNIFLISSVVFCSSFV